MKKAFYAISSSEIAEVEGLVKSFITSIESRSSSEYGRSKSELLENVESVSRRAVAISDESWDMIQGILKAKSSPLRKLSADIVWRPEASLKIANELKEVLENADCQILAQFLIQSSEESASVVNLTR